MFLVYTLCALLGAVFVLLTRLQVAPSTRAGDADIAAESASAPARPWALPLGSIGVVGLTLDLLGRDLLPTVVWSLVVGVPAGLLAAWVAARIDR
ncbi:MAG: hypothetical protein ABI333_05920 [bacterium]